MPTRRIAPVSIVFGLAVLVLPAAVPHAARVAAASGGANGDARIEGVVSERRDVNGKGYVRVTVGTTDGVRSRMRLEVVNGRGEVLGHVIVTAVEPDEAIGVLGGPRVNEIGPNDRVTDRPAGRNEEGGEGIVRVSG